MKYVKEIVIIFGITMVGELLNKFIPLPVPAGVYGLFILLGGLCSGIIKLSDVEVTGNLLLDLMPVMFIPAAVGIIFPVMIFINVDFPSPFAPMRPICSPFNRRKETSVKIARSPKPWLRCSTFKILIKLLLFRLFLIIQPFSLSPGTPGKPILLQASLRRTSDLLTLISYK